MLADFNILIAKLGDNDGHGLKKF